MVTFNIHGLTLTLVPKKTPANGPARTLMVNSSTSCHPMPTHFQRLFVAHGQWDARETTFLPISSEESQWRPEYGRGTAAWAITDCSLLVPHADSVIEANDKQVLDEYPDGSDASWHPLQWVVDANELLPSAKLKQAYRTLGEKIATEIIFMGGKVRGRKPLGEGGQWVWFIRPRMRIQAITDCLSLECSTPDADGLLRIEVRDNAGKPLGVIAILNDAQVFLVNEAKLGHPPEPKPKPEMPDLAAYFEAFAVELKHMKAVRPVALYPFPVEADAAADGRLVDTDYCIGGLVRE